MDEATARENLLGLADEGPGAALGVAVRLRLFTALAQRRRTAAELARDLGADRAALEVLANALVAIGLLEKTASRYANGELAAACLVAGATYLGDRVVAGRPRGTEAATVFCRTSTATYNSDAITAIAAMISAM